VSATVCPDPEALATLAEHQASALQRERLIRHITECHNCYVAFVETGRLINAVTSSGQPGAPSPLITVPRGPVQHGRLAHVQPWHSLLQAAAAALLVIGIGIAWLQVLRHQVATPHPQKSPLPARPAAVASPPGVPRPEVTIQRDAPAWITGAPWNSVSQSRSGFASAPSTRRAFLLGMHLASLERACREPASAARQEVVEEIDRSLRAAGFVAAGERQRLVAHASSRDCFFDSHVGDAAAPWLSLGRALEDWRIAAVERNPSAFNPERQRNLGRLLAVVELENPAQQLGARLAQQPRFSDGESWDSLRDALVELIELLCV
jgi:hypothetical protein